MFNCFYIFTFKESNQLNTILLKLSIIIVNYNVKFFVEKCLQSVLQAATKIEHEIFVIDNASQDNSKNYLPNKFPTVQFRWNETNVGFAKANNSVLSETKGDYILFLNPDTIENADCFEKCLSFMNEHKDCGALGVRMIDGNGVFLKESKRGEPSIGASFFKMVGLSKLFPRSPFFSKYYAGHINEFDNQPVEVLSGAFFMVAKNVLQIVKGFDEDYFMYGEDIDLSIRIRAAGFKNYYFSGTTITHFKGESSKKSNLITNKYFYGAMKIFVKKRYQQKRLLKGLVIVSIQIVQLLAVLKIYVQNSINKKIGNN